jgi:hypothetical protein
MDSRLANLIASYQAAVAECVQALVDAGATLPTRDYEWPPGGFPAIGKLPDGRDYFCHGVGCAVRSRRGRTVDFDFGENGEIDGFDKTRLLTFVGATPQKYGFETRDEISDSFDAAKSEFAFSGYILYHLHPAD